MKLNQIHDTIRILIFWYGIQMIRLQIMNQIFCNEFSTITHCQ